MVSLQNQLKALEFLKHHESTLIKEMHLHGPYICQYGILLNYPSFSEYDYLIIDVRSRFVEVGSINKVVKSKPRASINKKGKVREDRNMTARQGHKDIKCVIDPILLKKDFCSIMIHITISLVTVR